MCGCAAIVGYLLLVTINVHKPCSISIITSNCCTTAEQAIVIGVWLELGLRLWLRGGTGGGGGVTGSFEFTISHSPSPSPLSFFTLSSYCSVLLFINDVMDRRRGSPFFFIIMKSFQSVITVLLWLFTLFLVVVISH